MAEQHHTTAQDAGVHLHRNFDTDELFKASGHKFKRKPSQKFHPDQIDTSDLTPADSDTLAATGDTDADVTTDTTDNVDTEATD